MHTLTSIVLPNTAIIGQQALYGCSGITEIIIPSAVTTFQSNAFYGTSGLESVYYQSTLKNWVGRSFADGNSNPLNNNKALLYINDEVVEDLTAITSNTTIQNHAFYGYCGFTGELEIPATIQQ